MSSTKRNLIVNFNNNLRKFVNCAEKLYPGDAQIIKIRNSVFSGLAASEMIALETMGPYLFKYKDPVMRGDIDFFMNQEFNNAGDFTSLIQKIKNTLPSISEDERITIIQLVQDLTVGYIKFLIAEKSS